MTGVPSSGHEDQGVILEQDDLIDRDPVPVPSLFRQTLISGGKRREPTSNEIAGQMTRPARSWLRGRARRCSY